MNAFVLGCGWCREGFLGLSVADTIRHCLRLGLKDQAQRLAKEFKVGRGRGAGVACI